MNVTPLYGESQANTARTLIGGQAIGENRNDLLRQVLVATANKVGGAGGAGDVVGPSSATDNAIARYDQTTGKLIQDSGITIADGESGTLSGTNTGDVNLAGSLDYLSISGQEITLDSIDLATDVTGNLPLSNMATLNSGVLLGSDSTGNPNSPVIEISIGSGLILSGGSLYAPSPSPSGDVFGPSSATENALVRYDGTTGKLVQNGQVTQSDTGDIAAINSMAMDTTPTGSLTTQGQMMWNSGEETLDIQLNGFALHVGEHIVYHVQNSTGSTIAKGVPVMFAGTTGNSGKLLIQPWNDTGPTTLFMGLTGESLTTGSEGFVIAFGKLRGIQTNGGNYGETWVDGEIIYTGTTTGSLTKTQPAAPNPKIQVLAVVHAHASNGTFFIRPAFGSNIKDDEGVTITSLSTGQVLVANSAGTVFENKSVSGDATLANTGALTLATVNSNTGAFGSATTAPAVTVNAKGLVTAVSTNTITPAVGSITGLGTGVATALAVNVGSAGAPVVNGGALGTPSSGTLTNCTGLPVAGITASTSTALGVGSLEIGNASDTTLARSSAGNLSVEGNLIYRAGGSFAGMPFEYSAAVSDETTALAAGTNKLTFRMPCAMTVTSVRASVGTAPTGSTLIVDINENGTSILSTKLSIDATEKTSTTAAVPAVISDSALADDSEITIDIDQIGSTIAGAGLKVTLIGTRA